MAVIQAAYVAVGSRAFLPAQDGERGVWVEVTRVVDWSNQVTVSGIHTRNGKETMHHRDFLAWDQVKVR